MSSGPSARLIYLPGSEALLPGIRVSSCLPVSPAWCSLKDSCTHTLVSQATSPLAAPSDTSTCSQTAIYPSPDPGLPYSLLAQTMSLPRERFSFYLPASPTWSLLVNYTYTNTGKHTGPFSCWHLKHIGRMIHGPSSCWHHRHMDQYYLGSLQLLAHRLCSTYRCSRQWNITET